MEGIGKPTKEFFTFKDNIETPEDFELGWQAPGKKGMRLKGLD